MANVYVRSGAGGAGTGADWANAYTTLAAAYTAKAAGDDFWVAGDHAETQVGAMTLTCPGTLASPCRTICVNHLGTVPPVSADLLTTGTITTTTTGAITHTGCVYVYGLTFSVGSGANSVDMTLGSTNHSDQVYEACKFVTGGTSGGRIILGSSTANIGSKLTWINTTYQVSTVLGTIHLLRADFLWKNTATAIAGATIPTNLFGASTIATGTAVLDGVDLIALSTKTIVAAQTVSGTYWIKDCKLPASITINAAPTTAAVQVYVIRSASGATAYNLERHDARGDQTTETTIVRTGGAAVNGTSVAMKLVGTANARFQNPLTSTPIVINNTTTGADVTVTVYGIWAGVAVPTNKEVWMEVGYLGSALTPQLTFNTGTVADILATATNQTADAVSVWGGSTTAFKMVATLSTPQPQLAGSMYIVVKSASTNATYIDPLPVLS
jgi:hypothetical protein